MAGGFNRPAAVVSTLQTLGHMAAGAAIAAGGVVGLGQLEKAMNEAEANRPPQPPPAPLTPEEQAARQRLAEQKAWLQQQGGIRGLGETLAEGGQPAPWDSGWQRTLQARGQVK